MLVEREEEDDQQVAVDLRPGAEEGDLVAQAEQGEERRAGRATAGRVEAAGRASAGRVDAVGEAAGRAPAASTPA